MTSVVIGNNVTSIGESAFSACNALESIIVDEENTVYDSRQGCNAIIETSSNTLVHGCQSTIIPNSVTSIGYGAFYECSSLTSVVIPNSVTTIWDKAFWGCSSLTSVEIPNSVTGIGSSAFKDCSSLTSVEIGNSVTFIGNYAFEDCSSLTSIAVAEDNPTYDSRNNCNAIIETQTNTLIVGCSNTTIPNSVTSIGFSAFSWCSSLTSVEIPNSVTSIGEYAFYECSSLTSVEIPNSVTSIGLSAFSGTAWYNNQPDGVVYLDTYLLGYKGTMPSNTSIKIKEGTLLISDYAFSWCYGLTSVVIPNSVTSIGSDAFRECYSLTSVEIPNSVTSIGGAAFAYCSSLTSVEIPNSVPIIGNYAFEGCSGLTSITSYISADKLFEIDESGVFEGIDKTNCTLYVPYGAQETYAATEGWSEFTNIVEFYDLAVSNAGYATLYLDCAAEIPEGVEVYTAREIDGDRLKMDLVEGGVLPANTGVLVKASTGTYTFVCTEKEVSEIADNLFSGSATAEYIDVPSNKTAFVLSSVDGNVGMYLAKLTDGQFLNNANKAYLLLSKDKLGISDEEVDTSIGGMQLSLRFDFNGSTGIDGVQTETSVQGAIYDLYGRKLQSAPTKGLYIINGKKVLVK
ncbi:MAG: leucine-rich repeat domain-containing protein [Bacteroidaceae bacterium]|nr:leucine-rich repeat domain-containing protein [Bacteroidaceae bacterium]